MILSIHIFMELNNLLASQNFISTRSLLAFQMLLRLQLHKSDGRYSFLKKSLQEEDVCCISVSSEEDILFEKEISVFSVEIGHGSVLMKNPHWFPQKEVTKTN